ncbi:unnamed protein product, partial [Nesidiocoris tenuis]
MGHRAVCNVFVWWPFYMCGGTIFFPDQILPYIGLADAVSVLLAIETAKEILNLKEP